MTKISPWDGYRSGRKESYFEISLESFGLPEFKVKLRKPGTYTPAELHSLLDRGTKQLEQLPTEERENIPLVLVITGYCYLITEWSLTRPDNPEQVLPIPFEDLRSLSHVPAEIQWFLWEKIEQATEEMVPPKVRGIISTSGLGKEANPLPGQAR